MLPPIGDMTKPMLFATLSVEKPPCRTKINSPPEEKVGPKSAAFRAFSCNGQETLPTISRSVSENHSSLHKVAAFDGLLQYLQDYRHGLRELLVNNNVVIIEPVRQSTAKPQERKTACESTCRITGATVKKNNSTMTSNTLPRQQPILRRHFFYHPVRSNRELVDEELPDPDKVRHAREIFERTTTMKHACKEENSNVNSTINTKNNIRNSAAKTTDLSESENKVKRRYLTVDTVFRHNVLHKRWTDSGSLSSGVSSDLSCCETDVESADTFSRKEEPTDTFSSDDNDRNESDEGHYVPPEVLERIRACGTTVTYYGGQVISASDGPVRSPITLAIMDEIQKSKDASKKGQGSRITGDEYLGVRFRLVKSNSCGSRLELAGTDEEHYWQNQDDKCDKQVSDARENEDTGEEHTQQSSETVYLNSVLSKVNEGRPVFDQTSRCDKGRASKIFFSPEKPKLVERGNSVLFDDMEFEEFEIAEDSLNVIEEENIECNNSDEDVREVHPRDGQPVNVTGQTTEKQSNCSEEMSQSSTSKANDNVQMTTWASRSVLFDLKNYENEGSHPTQMSGPNHSSC
jgi:hypothetical protein